MSYIKKIKVIHAREREENKKIFSDIKPKKKLVRTVAVEPPLKRRFNPSKIFVGGLVLIILIVSFLIFSPSRDKKIYITLLRDSAFQSTSSAQIVEDIDEFSQIYINREYKFSINVPKNTEENVYKNTVVFENKINGLKFQIYIIPFEEGIITSSMIKNTLPNAELGKPERILINKSSAINFTSEIDGVKMEEFWFTNGGQLYQITSFQKQREQIIKILTTLKFN